MSLETGEQIGPYRDPGAPGAGRDGRGLPGPRQPPEPRGRAEDAARRGRARRRQPARFDRETRAVAALNHPNILAIHDIGSFRAIPWAVTELLQGETLAERLRSGAIAPEKAVDIAAQVADGLAAAHLRESSTATSSRRTSS